MVRDTILWTNSIFSVNLNQLLFQYKGITYFFQELSDVDKNNCLFKKESQEVLWRCGQIAETILFVWNHRCVLVWAMVWLAMGPFAACLCPLLRDYNYFGFILMHYHVVMKWNKLGVPSWLSLWPLWVSLSFFPPFLLYSWRLEKRICIKFFGFSGVDPQFDAPHSLFNSSTLFTILE